MLGRSIALSFVFLFSLINIEISNAALNCPIDTNNHSPQIVRINVGIKDSYCTGSIVGHGRYILTAAHCFKTRDKKQDPYKFVSARNIRIMGGPNSETDIGKARSIIIHPLYIGKNANYHDLAFIELETPLQDHESSAISFESINIGQVVDVGGYGVTQLNSFLPTDGHRRIGQSRIDSIDNLYICLPKIKIESNSINLFNTKYCIPSSQDSGSPYRINGNIHAVHVHSTQLWLQDNSTMNTGCGLNLRNPELKSFIQSVLSSKTKKAYKKQTQI